MLTDGQEFPNEMTKLKDVGLFKRYKTFPPCLQFLEWPAFVKVVTNEIRKIRWDHSTQDNLMREERKTLQELCLNTELRNWYNCRQRREYCPYKQNNILGYANGYFIINNSLLLFLI